MAGADGVPRFEPAPQLLAWIRATFIDGGVLHNPDHAHLSDAAIGVLWTNVANARQMRTVVATAEVPAPKGNRWQIARQKQQLADWFGTDAPDFVLTFSAPLLGTVSDRAFCAVVEHELYHCAQLEDEFGSPKFSKATGRPRFALRAHDVEEFVAVVRRYGATGDVRAMVDAATQAGPRVADADLAHACGTCAARVG